LRRSQQLLLLTGAGAAAAVLVRRTRPWVTARLGNLAADVRRRPCTLKAAIEVAVPVSTAYNQ